MQELQAKVAELLGQTIASGELDEMIRARLGKTIDDILDDLLKSWSPLGKSLKEQIGAGLNVNLNLGLGGYNQLVADIVQQRLDAAIHGTWAADMRTQLDEMLRAAPASIKLSELLTKLAEDHKDEAQTEEWEHATLLVEKTTYKSTWVHLDPKPRSEDEKYRFQWSLLIGEDGELTSVHAFGDSHRKDSRELFSRKRGMEALLFQLHAGKSKIEIDRGEGLHELEYEYDECRC